MYGKRMSFGWALVYLLPGNELNEQRKIFNQVIGPRAVTAFDTMLHEGAEDFVKALGGFSGDPEDITSQCEFRLSHSFPLLMP